MSNELSKAIKKKTDAQFRTMGEDRTPSVSEGAGGSVVILDPGQYQIPYVAGKNVHIGTSGSNKVINALMNILAGQNIEVSEPDENGAVTISSNIGGKAIDLSGLADGYVLKYDLAADKFILGEGGGISEVPQATETNTGGIKAAERTTESSEVKIDSATGKLFVPAPDEAANGIPAGGTAGQILVKIDNADYNAIWIDPPSGGSGGSGEPTGDGTTDVYSLTDSQSNGSFTGININMAIKGNWWLESIIFKPVGNIIGGTINLRTYSGYILQTIHNVNIAADEVGTVSLNEPILLNNGMLFRIEILFNGSMKLNRRVSFAYDGVLWKGEGMNLNTWTGAGYQEQLYVGLVEYLG